MNNILRKVWTLSLERAYRKLFAQTLTNRREFRADSFFRLSAGDQERVERAQRFEPFSVAVQKQPFWLSDAASFAKMVQEIFVNKAYEFDCSTKEPLIVDCGANIGISTLFFKTLYPSSRVSAFEADPFIFGLLAKNMKAFGLDDVELVNKAVWTSEGSLRFHSDKSWGGRVVDTHINTDGTITVEATRLKSHLHDLLSNHEHIHFLKIDIEGAETEVLLDIKETLPRVQRLFFEFHSFKAAEQKLDRLLSMLTANGFRYYIKEASRLNSPFITELGGDMDLQLDVFAWRSDLA